LLSWKGHSAEVLLIFFLLIFSYKVSKLNSWEKENRFQWNVCDSFETNCLFVIFVIPSLLSYIFSPLINRIVYVINSDGGSKKRRGRRQLLESVDHKILSSTRWRTF
jgi:hypothetical protein